ncbi:hypothetical protein [Bartonella machadoae]|nr:hypothetical protein [Bartonella machadoae]
MIKSINGFIVQWHECLLCEVDTITNVVIALLPFFAIIKGIAVSI